MNTPADKPVTAMPLPANVHLYVRLVHRDELEAIRSQGVQPQRHMGAAMDIHCYGPTATIQPSRDHVPVFIASTEQFRPAQHHPGTGYFPGVRIRNIADLGDPQRFPGNDANAGWARMRSDSTAQFFVPPRQPRSHGSSASSGGAAVFSGTHLSPSSASSPPGPFNLPPAAGPGRVPGAGAPTQPEVPINRFVFDMASIQSPQSGLGAARFLNRAARRNVYSNATAQAALMQAAREKFPELVNSPGDSGSFSSGSDRMFTME